MASIDTTASSLDRSLPYRLVGAALPALLLLLLAGQLGFESWADSIAFDEVSDVRSGTCAYLTGIGDLEPSHPPGFRLLAGASVLLFAGGQIGTCSNRPNVLPFPTPADLISFFPPDPARIRAITFAARVPMIALSLVTAMIVMLWAGAMYGRRAGLLALAFISLEPAFIGYGHIVGGDASSATGVIACLAAHWRWRTTGKRRWLLIAGLALGWALVCKVSSIQLLPILAVLTLLAPRVAGSASLRSTAVELLTIGTIGWAVVCVSYLPFSSNFPSHHAWHAPLSWVAPPSWFFSLWLQALSHVASGSPAFLNGRVYPSHGPFGYYAEAIALKTTLGLLIAGAVGAIAASARKDRFSLLYLLLPIAVVCIGPSLSRLDLGVRYVYAVYPLLAVLGASLLFGASGARYRTLAAVGLMTAVVFSSISHAPLHLGYTNELAGDRPEMLLSDSNLDWGQDAWRLRDWWSAAGRPELSTAFFGMLPLDRFGIQATDVRPTKEEVTGNLAVSVTRLTLLGDTNFDVYQGLEPPYVALMHRRPFVRIGTSVFVYRLPGT